MVLYVFSLTVATGPFDIKMYFIQELVIIYKINAELLQKISMRNHLEVQNEGIIVFFPKAEKKMKLTIKTQPGKLKYKQHRYC